MSVCGTARFVNRTQLFGSRQEHCAAHLRKSMTLETPASLRGRITRQPKSRPSAKEAEASTEPRSNRTRCCFLMGLRLGSSGVVETTRRVCCQRHRQNPQYRAPFPKRAFSSHRVVWVLGKTARSSGCRAKPQDIERGFGVAHRVSDPLRSG